MNALQQSLDGVSTRRRGGEGGFLATQSIDSANRTWVSGSVTAQSFHPSGLGKSKNYYMKYIHEDNIKRMDALQNYKSKFIPKSETEQKTYNQKFKHYMKLLEIEA